MSRTSNSRYRRNRARIKREQDTCHLCGQHIDTDLTFPHPMSWSADHITPVGRGGHNNGQLAAAHLRCNQNRKTEPPPPPHARQW